MLEKMHEESVRRDEYVDKEVDKHQERLAHHHHNLEVLRGKVLKLEESSSRLEELNLLLTAQVESMSDKLCRCHKGCPTLVGQGSREEPFELEYAGSPPLTTLLHRFRPRTTHPSPSLLLLLPTSSLVRIRRTRS